MFTATRSELLVPAARKVCEQIYAPMQWINSTKQAIWEQVAYDISLVANFVGSRQREKRLNREQCALLGDLVTEVNLEPENETEVALSLQDYVKRYATSWKISEPQAPSVRFSIFRKCDITFGTDYAHMYRTFLNQVANAFIQLSESLSSEQRTEVASEFDTLISLHALGIVDEIKANEERLALAKSLNSKIAKLSLTSLRHLDLGVQFAWLDSREVSIEFVLKSLAQEILLLNPEHKQLRLQFLESISPCIGVFAERDLREKLVLDALRDAHDTELTNNRPLWVELISFANQSGEPGLQTDALKLLCEFAAALLDIADYLNDDELTWKSTVLEALNEATLQSELADGREAQ